MSGINHMFLGALLIFAMSLPTLWVVLWAGIATFYGNGKNAQAARKKKALEDSQAITRDTEVAML
jgi:hypothetical protein